MTRKQQRLQEKPVKLLCLVPSPDQKPAANPFEPSGLRLAMRRVALKLEDWTERFETWCDRRTPCDAAPLSLTHRVQRLLGWSGAETTSVAVREPSMVPPLRGWESAMGEVIFRIRDRAGHVQRALLSQAHELKEWMAQHSQATQTELQGLRAQVATQEQQLETLSSQLQDLRALVSSQQQVLVYMGKELDTVHGEVPELAVPARRPATRSKKAAKAKRRAPAETGQAPYLNA